MSSEKTVLNPYVVITPQSKLSAYRLWASLPPYRLSSIFKCKPVFIKKENIKSAHITKSVWTFLVSNDDYDEILIRAPKDEVEGGFELTGPTPTSWVKLLKYYVIRSPSILTIAMLMILMKIGFVAAEHFRSEEFLNQYPLYHQFPKEFLAIVKTRIILWCVLVPTSLSPLLLALFGLSGFWKSKIGRIQSVIKVESLIMLIIGLLSLYNFPIVKFIQHSEALFAPLNSLKMEKIIQENSVNQNL